MRTLLVSLAVLFVLSSATTTSQRRLMKPDPAFGYGQFVSKNSWKVLAVYSQNNLEFFQQTQCLTLDFKYDPRHPSKYHSTASNEASNEDDGQSSSYFYNSKSEESTTTSGSESTTEEFKGIFQNMSWFNFSAGAYQSKVEELKFGQWEKGDTQDKGVFFESDSDNSDDEWIVSLSNGYFMVFGRKDATEIYLLAESWLAVEGSDDSYYLENGLHAFNASLLDTQNVIYNSTFAPSCQIFGTPSKNFTFEEFAAKSWYVQTSFFPLEDDNPPGKALCGELEVVNSTIVNNITVFNLANSGFMKNSTGTYWETQIFEYWSDPLYPAVFRPLSPNAPTSAMVVYYFDSENGSMLWAVNDRSYGYYLVDEPIMEDSEDINTTSDIVNKINKNNEGGQVFRATSCNYH